MTTLAEIRDSGTTSSIPLIALRSKRNFKTLVIEIQSRLADLGLLDPPADGDFGPVSHWAMGEFCRIAELDPINFVDSQFARALLAANVGEFLSPPALGRDLASRAIAAMSRLGYWVSRHPEALNVVYVEGWNADGTRNDNRMDAFNDLRMLIRVRDGHPEMLGCWAATTEPGKYWTEHPDPTIADPVKAAAHIALGQFKAWVVGMHKGTQDALVQRERIRIFRDANKDGLRTGDPVFEGAAYGINQHHANDAQHVGRYSAGCLVGQSRSGHIEFMSLLKSDPRYRANNAYRFMTAVLGQDQLDA